jgi:hypothetical protein
MTKEKCSLALLYIFSKQAKVMAKMEFTIDDKGLQNEYQYMGKSIPSSKPINPS